MKKELQIWQFIAERLGQKQSVVLLVVAESLGSSPGRQGFKMAVAEDELCGSIGGGVMEVKLVEDARIKIKSSRNKSSIIKQVHQKNSINTSGMICSGKQTVLFFELNIGHLETVNKIISALEKSQTKFLQITDSKIKLSKKTSTNRTQNSYYYFNQLSENNFLYEETLGYKNKLFIVGGGHCALALSELMLKMDFHISLFDDRPDLNTLAKNEFVQKKQIIESYDEIDKYIESGLNHYVVVMTLGYKFDEIVIRKLFGKDFKYFGVLGSKAKMAVLLRDLQQDGYDKKRLDNIHTPIGLQIKSQTPEEIAVSIVAEIIAIKNSKS